MKLSRYSLLLAGGIVGVFATILTLHWPDEPPAPATAVEPRAAAPGAAPPVATIAVAEERPGPAAAPARTAQAAVPADPRFVSDHEARFRAATDYLAFARDMLDRARAGEPDAQFHLYAALDYCRRGYRDHFDRGQQRRTLDEALGEEGTSPSANREIREVFSRCHDLMSLQTGEFGEAEQWLQRSARAGHPRAQAQLALWLIARSGALAPEQATRSTAEARRFLRESLASGDPQVIWTAAVLPGLSDNGDRERAEMMAWWQAACDRGLDCGAGSEHARELCRFVPDCQASESVNDMLVRSAQNPATVADRARQINASLAARDFRSLGLE